MTSGHPYHLCNPEVIDDIARRLHGAKILLMEDNDINRERAPDLLTSNALIVKTAGNGQQALDFLEDRAFYGVLMSCQIPVLDGYQASRWLIKQERFHDLPILAMTAHAMAGDREKVLDAGMNDPLAKPINVEYMFRTMAQWFTPADPGKQPALSQPVLKKLTILRSDDDTESLHVPEQEKRQFIIPDLRSDDDTIIAALY